MARTVVIEVEVDADGVVTGVKRADGALVKLGDTTEKTKKRVFDLGQVFNFSLGQLAADAIRKVGQLLVGTAKQTVEYEQAMTAVRKTTGLSREETTAFGKDLLVLSGRLGMGQMELAAIAETAGQLGIQGRDNLLAFTESVAKLAAVSELSAEEAATQIARIANGFDLPIMQADALGSVLNELSNTTTAKAGDISSALTRVGKAGSSIGFTVDQVAALSATLIDSGIEAERSGTGLRNIFVRLQTEGERLGKVAGVTREAFNEMVQKDALGALQAYLTGLRDMPPALAAIRIKEVFGDENFLAVQTLATATELLDKNLRTSQTAFKEGTSLNREFSVSLENVAAQFSVFTANLSRIASLAGGTFLPALQDLLRGMNDLLATTEQTADEVLRLRGALDEQREVDQMVKRLEELESATSRTKEETAEYQKLLDEFATRYPEYVKGYDALGKATGIYVGALREALENQRALMRLQLQDELGEIGDSYEKLRGAVARANKEQAQSEGILKRLAELNLEQSEQAIRSRLILRDAQQDAAGAQKEMARLAAQAARLFDPATVSADMLQDELQVSEEAAKELVTALRQIAGARKVAVEAPDPKPVTPTGGGGLTEEEEKETERKRKELARLRVETMEEGLAKELARIDLEFDETKRKIQKNFPALAEELVKQLEAFREQARDKAFGLEEVIDIKLDDDPLDDLLKEQKEFLEETDDALNESAKRRIEIREKEKKAEKELQKEIRRGFEELFSAASQLFSAIQQRRQQAIESEAERTLNALETAEARQLEAIDRRLAAETLSEEQRQALLKERQEVEEKFAKRRAALEKEFAVQRAEALRKTAAMEKRLALFRIAVETAVNVVEAFPNVLKMIAAGALGAVQAGVVLATPLPEVPSFRQGVEAFGGGLAQLHKDELVMLPPGASVMSQVRSRQLMDAVRAGSGDGAPRGTDAARAVALEVRRALEGTQFRQQGTELRGTISAQERLDRRAGNTNTFSRVRS